jgi:hypothetical protein
MTTGQEVKVPEATFKDHLLGWCKALKANEKQIFGGESGKKVGAWISLYYHVDREWVASASTASSTASLSKSSTNSLLSELLSSLMPLIFP